MSVVIIPAYKPDQTLVALTDMLWEYGCQIIVVDDGSGEEFRQIFDRIKDICIVLRHTQNLGKGAAYFALAGFILVMNNLILELFVQILRIPVYSAKLLTEFLLFVMSWLVQEHVIFRKGKRPKVTHLFIGEVRA